MNTHKTISANSKGIIVSFGDINKHRFIKYDNNLPVVKTVQMGTAKYQNIVSDFTPKQSEIFYKTLYGFEAYTEKEIQEMPFYKKDRVSFLYNKARKILHIWKQELLFKAIDDMLISLFPHSKIVKQFVEKTGYLNTRMDDISIYDLGITDLQIAQKLIRYNVLPKNFFNLA